MKKNNQSNIDPYTSIMNQAGELDHLVTALSLLDSELLRQITKANKDKGCNSIHILVEVTGTSLILPKNPSSVELGNIFDACYTYNNLLQGFSIKIRFKKPKNIFVLIRFK